MDKKKIPKESGEISRREKGEVSRRDFLIGAGAVVVGGAIGAGITYPLVAGREVPEKTTTVEITKTVTPPATTVTTTVGAETVTTTKTVGAETVTSTVPGPTKTVTTTVGDGPAPANVVKFTVNGETCELVVEPEWTLQYVLHDKLGLIGTKLGCDRGACGSCAVNIDGRPVLSCMTLADECGGKSIETVEGVAQVAPALIEAYIKHECMQCGYCTPGFIVTAKALLDRNPDPNEDEIKQALAGNLCRCGTYPLHPIAIMEAAKELKGGG